MEPAGSCCPYQREFKSAEGNREEMNADKVSMTLLSDFPWEQFHGRQLPFCSENLVIAEQALEYSAEWEEEEDCAEDVASPSSCLNTPCFHPL